MQPQPEEGHSSETVWPKTEVVVWGLALKPAAIGQLDREHPAAAVHTPEALVACQHLGSLSGLARQRERSLETDDLGQLPSRGEERRVIPKSECLDSGLKRELPNPSVFVEYEECIRCRDDEPRATSGEHGLNCIGEDIPMNE